jgi:hypothetical protein
MAKKKKKVEVEFEYVANPSTEEKEIGTCDNCKYNRYSVMTSEGKIGFCEVGSDLRGHYRLPPENTCQAWIKRNI